ncbi:sigma-54-dependent transcriptional regulator [Kiritimatiella glycovorans]|uniref:Transcriptional regulatory protein ZraR n=1 Tax=Kiritimatiella glycovorans TaxID=1307763 RepID=A0A0G3EC01_9BACT|nr:sigma-54 dependent transcriptional regulator [Kiritimatiella glycovorans]AKJ64021.1 Transcriptional regulatory protein ZraR [Kiritimatiella glycovorans]
MKPVVLIVDDEKNTRDGLARALRGDYRILLADSGESALEILDEESIDVLLADIRMPGMDGITLMQRALAKQDGLTCILLTAYGSIEKAVEAMKRGAHDFLTKPVHLDRLELVLSRALESRRMQTENRALREQLDTKYGLESIIGQSEPMQRIFDKIRQVAPSRATVLIQGESGTGKELVARALHRLSPRAQGPFVPVHCAALSSNLLESELFGHEKGAFTGAVERRRGRFERADGGTLFLDEIAEIDPSIQVKILRVLEQRAFERVGGTESVEVDTRLLTATNRDLTEEVEKGAFREDLFYRLDVVSITVPPLRERAADIPLLLNHFLQQFSGENGKRIEGFTQDAAELLSRYEWPGNVRELRNAVENMVVMSRGEKLGVRDVPPKIRAQVDPARAQAGGGEAGAGSLRDMEMRMILRALKETQGNRTKAAEQLGISRRTMHRKLNEYGLQNY